MCIFYDDNDLISSMRCLIANNMDTNINAKKKIIITPPPPFLLDLAILFCLYYLKIDELFFQFFYFITKSNSNAQFQTDP